MIDKRVFLQLTMFFLNITTIFSSEPIYQKSLIGKVIDALSQSKAMCWYNKKTANLLKNIRNKRYNYYSDELASIYYQSLGLQAQHATKTSHQQLFSIKKLVPDSLPAHATLKMIFAIAGQDAIYINEQALSNLSYGQQRCTMFHEAVHMKYNDYGTNAFLAGTSCMSMHILLDALKKKLNIRGKYSLAKLCLALLTGLWTGKKHNRYAEKRADAEGFSATQCWICVRQKSWSRHAKNDVFFFDGEFIAHKSDYLYAEEVFAISQELKKQGKICAYHKDNESIIL